MAAEEGKIYNDAPDEFAEFLDSGRLVVTLSELGGRNNPFIKEGIYKEADPSVSPYAQLTFTFNEDVENPKIIGVKCITKDYAIDHSALAEFMSKGLGCTICRQFKKTGWQFGKLRGYDVYFAGVPTDGMYRALESAPRSVLIIGQNNPKTLPSSLATRVIYLSRLLYVSGGALHFADEVVEEKIPLARRRAVAGGRNGEPSKKQARPPVQVYTPYYLSMMAEWLEKLQKEGKTGQPSKKWMAEWLYKNGPSINRRRLSVRQVYRHIEKLTAQTPPPKGEPDYRSAVFTAQWNGCLDWAYVARFSVDDITDAFMSAVDIAKKQGFKVKPMRGRDAADVPDKVRIPYS